MTRLFGPAFTVTAVYLWTLACFLLVKPVDVELGPWIEYTVTGYAHGCTLRLDGKPDIPRPTASGVWPVAGETIATDWNIHPPGTKLEILGKVWTSRDKGGKIKGSRIDLFMESCSKARQFGIQKIFVREIE